MVLTITIPDEFDSRVLTAFGHDERGVWIPGTQEDVQVRLETYTRQTTYAYEDALAAQETQQERGQERW